jgi:hypothetical protein
MNNILKRTTLIVRDAERSLAFSAASRCPSARAAIALDS